MNRNLGSASHLGQFPPELQNIIDQSDWSYIVTQLQSAESDAMLMACGGEWCCCLCTGFFCIFCFHPMFNDALAKSNLEKTCRKINAQYFRGSPTFYVDSGMNIYLGVNTLNQFQSYSTPYPVESPMVRPYDYQDKHAVANPVYVEQNTPPVVPVMVTAHVVQPTEEEEPPPEQSARHAQFVVPEGVSPGTTVTTVSPAGGEVSIVIPNNSLPGSVVTYSY